MPEYLAAGVYVEEISFRSKSIEGVSTSTAGFVGPTRFGPTAGEPELVTSFGQFERIYGSLDRLVFKDKNGSDQAPVHNYLAHAVRAFFDNGGRRLYVARAFEAASDGGVAEVIIPAPSPAIALADRAAENAAGAAKSALVAAQNAADDALETTIDVLDATLQTVWAQLPDGVQPPQIDLETADRDAIKAAVDAHPDANFTQPQKDAIKQAIDTDPVDSAIDDAVAARTQAGDLKQDATTEAQNAAHAIADGKGQDDPGTPPPDLTTANGAAKTSADDANAKAETASARRADLVAAWEALKGAAAAERLNKTQAMNTAAEAAITAAVDAHTAATDAALKASRALRSAQAASVGTFQARFPGAAGNVTVAVTFRVGENVLRKSDGASTISQVQNHDLVLLTDAPTNYGLFVAELTAGGWSFTDGNTTRLLSSLDPDVGHAVRVCTFAVEALGPGQFDQPLAWNNLSVHPQHRASLHKVFAEVISNRAQMLETPIILDSDAEAVALAAGLLGSENERALLDPGPADAEADEAILRTARTSGLVSVFRLEGGNDGLRPGADTYKGDVDANEIKRGLMAFEDLEEISIVAAPGLTYQNGDAAYAAEMAQAIQHLIGHCETMRYRVAVIDSGNNQAISQVRNNRAVLDTTRAALYYPWVQIQDPVTREPITVPPSGFVVGIYARNDIERGVHKAPANEVMIGAIGLEIVLNKAQQDILNPLGINCLRYFENRGFRVWGARTLSSDPEWKYLNIRRYFAYLERSIERSTQWAVFEPNGEALWANVRRAVEDFLYNEWKSERLAGTSPEEAFFVRCDRSTMTQNDLDNGRMICLIGVAPLYPAEFVIFRIGQWTADRRA